MPPTRPPTNLQILKPSRRRLRAGDIFVCRPAGYPYYFGRVIKARTDLDGMPATLIYLYKATSEDPSVVPALHCNELLVPPMFTNRLPWSRGYFVNVTNAGSPGGIRFNRMYSRLLRRSSWTNTAVLLAIRDGL